MRRSPGVTAGTVVTIHPNVFLAHPGDSGAFDTHPASRPTEKTERAHRGWATDTVTVEVHR